MTTSKGELVLKLYNQTPIHRDNFIKHVNNQFYNGISFHRVIKNFMAQAGDPNSETSIAAALVIIAKGRPSLQKYIHHYFIKKELWQQLGWEIKSIPKKDQVVVNFI